jgi:nucleotide-binding universal stress UspA family protein
MEFDVFLCHNGQDKPEVKKIAETLKQQGLTPWLDEWELQPGLPWQRELEKQIQNIKSAAVFVGGSGIGPWQQMEIEAALSGTSVQSYLFCYPMRPSNQSCHFFWRE